MKISFFLLSAALLLSGCSKSDTESEAKIESETEFTRRFAESLRTAEKGIKVTATGDLQLSITTSQGRELTSHLGNAYESHLQNPKDTAAIIQSYVDSTIETLRLHHVPVAVDRIVPIIKDRAWIQEALGAALQQEETERDLSVFEKLNEELVIVFAEDTPHNIRYLTPDQVSDLEIQSHELRPLAIENLQHLLPDVTMEIGDGLYRLTAGGTYEASLLLLDEIWNTEKLKVEGDFVAAIPSRDLLMVTGSAEPQALERLKNLVREVHPNAAYRLTPKLFIRREGRFVVLSE